MKKKMNLNRKTNRAVSFIITARKYGKHCKQRIET